MSGGPSLRLCRWRALSLIRDCRLGKMMERCSGWRPELQSVPTYRWRRPGDLRLVRQFYSPGACACAFGRGVGGPAVRVNRVA